MHADANNINYCSATDGAKIKCKTHLIFFAQLFGETILQISGPSRPVNGEQILLEKNTFCPCLLWHLITSLALVKTYGHNTCMIWSLYRTYNVCC